jgi:hypothetical protein
MLPKFRSFVRLIIRSFVRSFIVPIHRSSFVHRHYSSFIVRSYDYSPSLFTITIHHPSLFTIAIHRYYSLVLFTNDIYGNLFAVTIHCYYSLLLFIDHPITLDFSYSSVMLSSPPKTSQTNISVIRTLVTVIFLPVGTSHLVTHPRFLQVEHA